METFDAAITVVAPDEELLSGAPARSLMAAMQAVVGSLRNIDAERVARKQTWFNRFTGADIEARLEFELAIRSVGDQMLGLARAATDARRACVLMEGEIAKLDGARSPNEILIAQSHEFLAQWASSAETARLERRLANLESLHASNLLARSQAVLIIDSLNGLLDRYREIESLLFPIWQQHALAVAQGVASPDEFPTKMSALDDAQSRFDVALRDREPEQ